MALRALKLLRSSAGQGSAGLSAYEIAKRDGFTGTEAEWLASLQGPAPSEAQVEAVVMSVMESNPTPVPADGKSVEISVSDTAIRWRQTGGNWTDLIPLSSLIGPAGHTGSAGASGATGSAGTTGLKGDTGATGAVGPKGDKGDTGAPGVTGVAGVAGAKGDKGDTGVPGAALIGSVVIGQTAAIAIALGIREVTAALAGAVVGARYVAFAESYRLNGGASVSGRPSGYSIVDCVCNTVGQITISLNAPLLAIGASYAITCGIVRINA